MKIDILSKSVIERMTNLNASVLSSGFTEIDKNLLGWGKGELILISGRPSMGKTSFMASLIVNMSVKSNIPVGVFSLESSENQLISNLLSNYSQIDNHRLTRGLLTDDEWIVLDMKIKEIVSSDIFIECPSRLLIQDLYLKAKELVVEEGVQAIFIDYVQLLTVTDKYTDNRYNEMNYISRELKALARELDIPIFVISQMNRSSETDRDRQGVDGKRPRLSDLRDSGTLCDDADVVLFIFRPEYYRITEDERGNSLLGVAEIMVQKNRNGSPFSVNLHFNPEYRLFSNIIQ